MTKAQPWWVTDKYDIDTADPAALIARAGPHGIAAATVYSSGRTQPGWGLLGKKRSDGTREPGFMSRYPRKEFDHRKARWAYMKRQQPFAFVMRSVQVVVLDVDGKNDGLQGVLELEPLPPTLAETSKSGTGLHLFYSTDEPWSENPDTYGYARFDDHIGIAPGVDFRGTGCVFHYPTQRWNSRDIAPIPKQLVELLDKKKNQRVAGVAAVANMKEMDDVDLLITQSTLLEDLEKDIPQGKRNNTLFAIGSKMKAAGIEGWADKVHARALAVGLDKSEADKLVNNIATYGE